MNGKDGFRSGLRPKISNCLKDREEELSFFREIQIRGKETSLLQPISDEFDANGNYGMDSIGRKGIGPEFPGEVATKNDYNWLKTPPATPLFPSLEMERNKKEMLIVKELPIIIQPLSRFAGKDISVNTKIIAPNDISLLTPIHINRHLTKPSLAKSNITCSKPTQMEKTKPNLFAPNLRKTKPSTTNIPKGRGISPSVRPAQIEDQTPANLRTAVPQIKQARIRTAESDGKGSVLGSRMVEKLMNARISNAQQRQGKMMGEKSRNGEERVMKMNERPRVGMVSKISSLGISTKHKICH